MIKRRLAGGRPGRASAADGTASVDRKGWVGCTISMINGAPRRVKQIGPVLGEP